MRTRIHVGEYESEPIPGLPGELPEGEHILWQGSPSWRAMARRAFHARKVAVYFGLLIAWSLAAATAGGEPALATLASAGRLTALAASALGILVLFAWLNARATLYTITDRRVVLRFGVALTMAVNLPFRGVRNADLRAHPDGTGDIALAVEGAGRIGYLMLWPYVRPWRFGRRAEPTLRAVPDAEAVARTLVRAVVDAGRRAPADRVGDEVEGVERPSLATAAA